jgi:imidazolonepropionase-like amidohydrolase
MKPFLAATLLVVVAQPAHATTIAIVGGTVAPIPDGVVLFRNGRIIASGANVTVPADAKIIDAHHKWVAAGMIAGFSNLGLYDSDAVDQSDDTGAKKSSFSASIDVSTALNPAGAIVALERSGGITKAIVSPAARGSIFGGEGALMDLGAGQPACVKRRAFELVELGQDGARLAGGSRPAAYALLDEAFKEAERHQGGTAGSTASGRKPMFARLDLEALRDVIEGQIPLLAHAERASDIKQVLALRLRYPKLRLVLLGAAEGWLVASDIARAGVPVIASALTDLPEESERIAATESNVGRLERAGVKVAISTVNMTEPIQQRRVNQLAGNLVAIGRIPGMSGMSWGQAFATITARPAEAIGVDQDVGSLKPGRRADIVIWNGDPLELKSAPEAVFIDGEVQSMETRQSELLRRYRTVGQDSLPAAYRR